MEFLLLTADVCHLAAEKQVRRDEPRQISRQSAWKFFDNTLQGASRMLLKVSAFALLLSKEYADSTESHDGLLERSRRLTIPYENSSRRSDNSKHSDSPPDDTIISGTASKSHSSPCSRSSCSSNCCSARAQQHVNGNGALLAETSNGVLKRTCSSELAELYSLNNEGEPDFLSRSHAHNTGTISEQVHQSVLETPTQFGQSLRGGGVFRVKAFFGEEKVTFFLQPNWGLRNLQQEVGKRFQIDDFTGIGLKYKDDDGEWIRLTCDGDLEDCKDTHRFCQSNTIKISLYKYSSAFVCQESC
ncbi:hypothetical protein OIU85_000333 [Salix viminalis]|uniref:PB1 domain-containing protein n=1 Tax=Salix viminalis TaxID=40686 RepID=A0A9Q0VJS7_SALVM|nr:hypothetical protein OIU85_000333 [Salix viminalis]